MKDGLDDFIAIFRDRVAQRIFVSSAFFYCIIFAWVSGPQKAGLFWRVGSPVFWLSLFGVISFASYLFYDPALASSSTQALVLLAGTALGNGMKWQVSGHTSTQSKRVIHGNLAVLGILLFTGLFCNSSVSKFRYGNQIRWTGIWDSPNAFGLLMGVGAILGLGIVMPLYSMIENNDVDLRQKTRIKNGKPGLWLPLEMIFFAVAAGCMGMGLFKSYSRGAWLGIFCGLTYMFSLNIQNLKARAQGRHVTWLSRNWLPLCVILIFALVLFFWRLRPTDRGSLHRALSSVNPVDFSWRNRVSAWVGELQIMAEHPWFGVGWNRPVLLYQHYYLPPKVSESAAIGLNDYLMLGGTLGIPALFCFCMYLWFSLMRRSENREISWLKTICHAGAIVLLIGFWIDGGLFKLATASVFWILLGLGSEP